MTKLTLVVALLVTIMVSSISAQTTGFVYGHYEVVESAKPDLSRVRVRVARAPTKESCGGLVEVDIVDAGNSYLHQAWFACQMSSVWTVKTGRLFSSALVQSPPPFLLKTVRYQDSWTYAAYAYGIQIERKLDNGWQMGVDLTGRSGLKYNDMDNIFNRAEVAGRIVRKGGKTLSYGGAIQASPDFLRAGLDMEVRVRKMTTNALVAYTTERAHVEGFVFTEYQLSKWLLPHVQLETAKEKTSLLVGVGMKVTRHVYFVVDHHSGYGYASRLHFMVRK